MHNDPSSRQYRVISHIDSLKWFSHDYISHILQTKAITHATIVPKDYIHITARDLLYLLLNFNIRPPL